MDQNRQPDGRDQVGTEESASPGSGAAGEYGRTGVWPTANHVYGGAPGTAKHSGIGIASFIVALVGIVLIIVAWMMILMSVVELDPAAALEDPESMEQFAKDLMTTPEIVGGSLLLMLSAFLLLIGTILGIVSLFQQQRKKLFPILGTVLNVIPLLLLILIMAWSFLTGI